MVWVKRSKKNEQFIVLLRTSCLYPLCYLDVILEHLNRVNPALLGLILLCVCVATELFAGYEIVDPCHV